MSGTRLKLDRIAAILREEARMIFDNYTDRHGEWPENTEDEQLRHQEYLELARAASAPGLLVQWRPLLTSGMLATSLSHVIVLIDEAQSEHQQLRTLFHEMMHLLGLKDETQVESFASLLASAAPGVLAEVKKAQQQV